MQTLSPLRNQFWSSISGHTWRTMPQYFNDEGRIAGCLEFSPARHQLGHSVCLKSFSSASTPSLQTLIRRLATSGWWTWPSHLPLYLVHFPSCIHKCIMLGCAGFNVSTIGRPSMTPTCSMLSAAGPQFSPMFQSLQTSVVLSIMTLILDPAGMMSLSTWVNLIIVCLTFLHLEWNCCTVAAFSGQLIRHGVNAVAGNRCCLTYYMWDNIHHWLNVPRCDFVRVESLKWSLLDPQFMGVNTL